MMRVALSRWRNAASSSQDSSREVRAGDSGESFILFFIMLMNSVLVDGWKEGMRIAAPTRAELEDFKVGSFAGELDESLLRRRETDSNRPFCGLSRVARRGDAFDLKLLILPPRCVSSSPHPPFHADSGSLES